MDMKSRRPKDREDAISSLKAAIEATNLAKGLPTITSTEDFFWLRQRHPHSAQSGFMLVCVDRLQAKMHLEPGGR